MKPSPLHLTDYFVTDLHFSANSKFDSNQEVQINFDDFQVGVEATAKPENKRGWQVILKLQHQPSAEANVPYRFTAEIIGLFIVVENCPEEHIERLVRTNGASMLYGILREVIRDTTARGPYSAILLPSTSFYERDKTMPATEISVEKLSIAAKEKSSAT
jgi:preprotein translocase subunit SecB